ncbi:MAG: Kdo hydroxylase family protein, partial [Burkholderiales bacterium]
TKSRRTPYDHWMLQLHDRVKADLDYQRNAAQQHVEFASGTTWVVFSDQVLHAAMAGQFMLEQTFLLDVEHQAAPETSPLRTLERLLGRTLVPASGR